MLRGQDVNYSLISAVRKGRLERARELINSFGLSYSEAWSKGYTLLCDAVKYEHAAVAKLLLTSGSKVNSKNTKPADTPLHFAAINGDIEIVKMILDKGAYIDAKNKYGRTPLHNAIENMKIEVTELLLKHRADVNATDNDGKSLLHIATEVGCLQIVEHLLKYGAYANVLIWRNNYAPLHNAVERGHKELITLLLNTGANVDVKGEDSITPLHIATKKGYNHIAEDLLNHGACIHSLTMKEGYTPLHFASELGDEKAVELLLNRGADSNASTKDNLTPLHIATKRGCKTVVKLLLQHKAKIDNQDKDGKTMLQLAVENSSLSIVEDVLKYCPDINNQSNRSSLYIAMYGNGKEYKKIVETLLEYGLVVYPEDANNPKLLHAAVEKGCLKIIEDLLKYGADVNTLYNTFTPLHMAAKHKQEGAAKLLISYGADINAQDKNGKTPIFYAVENADFKITMLLLTNRANIKDSPKLLSIAVKKECIEIVEALLAYNVIVSTTLSDTTLLHDAAHVGNKEISIMLLNNGANVNAKQKDGTTALHIATREGHKEVVKLLLECGAQVDSKMKINMDMTPLHFGADNGYVEIIKTILKFGADINSRDNFGRTALHIASQKMHAEVVATLLESGADINITSSIINHTPLDVVRYKIKTYDFDSYSYDSDYDYLEYKETCFGVIRDMLEGHIVKMKTANLYVSEKNLRSVNNSCDLKDECEEEIARMKSEEINKSNISFYDVLVKDTSSLAIYMRNENIVQVLKSDDYKTNFPIYASMIESSFTKGMERKELLEQGNTFFNFLSLPELTYDCTEKIFSYLSVKDLKILIDACKPLCSNLNTNINM